MADLNYYFGPWQRDAEQGAWVAPSGTVGLLDFGSLNDCALSPSAIDQRGIGLFCIPRSLTLPSEYDLLDSGDCREIQVIDAHRNIVEAVLGVRIEAGGTLAEACAALFAAGDPTGQERWKPLTPTREGVYEIHLGGHSTIFARKFDGPADKTWNKLKDLLRHDLQRHDDECKAEAKALKDAAKELRKQNRNGNSKKAEREKQAAAMDARADKVENHAEKVLDAMCRKYKCDPIELSQTIRRGNAKTTISDAFDSAIGNYTSYEASTWANASGACGKTTNDTTHNVMRFDDYSLSSADHYCQAEVLWSFDPLYFGPAARFSSSAGTCYHVSGEWKADLYKMVTGTRTWLGRGTIAHANVSGETWKIDCAGSTITGWVTGGDNCVLTDTSISSGVKFGLYAYRVNLSPYFLRFGSIDATDGIATGHPTTKRFGGVPFTAVNKGVW